MYNIKKTSDTAKELITITDYCNMNNDYKPRVDFSVTYDEVGFHAHFDVYESNPRAVHTENFKEICEDSCVEWFIYFAPDICNRYFNFEVNANGAMDVSFRIDRDDYIELNDDDVKLLNVKAWVGDNIWTVDYTVSYEFLKKFIDGYEFKEGAVLRANVYKCGDKTEFEHYGCWGMVDRDEPDFHKPEYFKEMKISS